MCTCHNSTSRVVVIANWHRRYVITTILFYFKRLRAPSTQHELPADLQCGSSLRYVAWWFSLNTRNTLLNCNPCLTSGVCWYNPCASFTFRTLPWCSWKWQGTICDAQLPSAEHDFPTWKYHVFSSRYVYASVSHNAHWLEGWGPLKVIVYIPLHVC